MQIDGSSLWIALAIVLAFFVLMFIASGIKVLKEWERVAVLRLGKFRDIKGPGIIFIFPMLDKIAMKVSLRLLTYAFKTERSLTKDNVPVVVERRIYAINRVHERCEGEELSYGVLGGWEPAGVVVVPLGSAERYRGRGLLVTCTGWAATWRSLTSLPLSSHSGFDELLEYVRRSEAELVIPAYGFVDEFARHVAEELGVRCAPIRRGHVVSETI